MQLYSCLFTATIDITNISIYNTTMPDIDIDVADRNDLLKHVKHTRATIIDDKGTKPHNTGVYFTEAPRIPNTEQCSIDYKVMDQLGYFKIDVLNVNLYSQIKSREHLQEMFDRDPPWHRLDDKEFVDQLFHLNGHHNVVSKLMPANLEQLAATLAVIRPAKYYLIEKTWPEILEEVWVKPKDDRYFFKKAHAFGYAGAVIVNMNLLDSSN